MRVYFQHEDGDAMTTDREDQGSLMNLMPEELTELIDNAAEVERKLEAFDSLLSACRRVDSSLIPYRGEDAGEYRAYLCGRPAIATMRAAVIQAKEQ